MNEREIEAQRNRPISFFRGVHRFLIACLTLQSFFIAQTLETYKTVYYQGLVIVTALALIALLVLTGLKVYNVNPLSKAKKIWCIIGILLIISMFAAPILIGLIVIDLILLALGILNWIKPV